MLSAIGKKKLLTENIENSVGPQLRRHKKKGLPKHRKGKIPTNHIQNLFTSILTTNLVDSFNTIWTCGEGRNFLYLSRFYWLV